MSPRVTVVPTHACCVKLLCSLRLQVGRWKHQEALEGMKSGVCNACSGRFVVVCTDI